MSRLLRGSTRGLPCLVLVSGIIVALSGIVVAQTHEDGQQPVAISVHSDTLPSNAPELVLNNGVLCPPRGPIFMGDSATDQYTVDETNGNVNLLGASGGGRMFDIAIDPAGVMYGVADGTRLVTLSTVTGAITSVIGPTGVTINGLVFRNDGTLFGSGSSQVYTLSTGAGTATALPSPIGGGCFSAGDLEFDDAGNLYISCTNQDLVRINQATGAGALVGNMGLTMFALAFLNGQMYGLTTAGDIVEIDHTNGATSNSQPLSGGAQPFGAATRPQVCGACCIGGGTPNTPAECIQTTQDECERNGDLFLGVGVPCEQTDCLPLVVTYDSVTVERTPHGALVTWTTESEIDAVGFRVLREKGAEKTIEAISGLIPAGGHGLEGMSYQFLDNSKQSESARYYIEDIDIFGRVNRVGPFAVQPAQPVTKPGTRVGVKEGK